MALEFRAAKGQNSHDSCDPQLAEYYLYSDEAAKMIRAMRDWFHWGDFSLLEAANALSSPTPAINAEIPLMARPRIQLGAVTWILVVCPTDNVSK